MATEEQKYLSVERPVFLAFIKSAKLLIDHESICKEIGSSMPDISCRLTDKTHYFELVEICDSRIAEANAFELKNFAADNDTPASYTRAADPTGNIIRDKFKKTYNTSHPIDLLCYVAGRTVSPDDLIISRILEIAESKKTSFNRIWLYGEKYVYSVWPQYIEYPR
ncbi:hypothetical protein [Undibacterium terreum]|uniref:Uncharacterized protein n=1 Tax=Undibacterium terreum TaxID=1224302 RepID=A0A916U3U3_9BURK|nr:hypothetical protein [Undibacterium terreum]GGC57676.1 hypothetical protein GCM10011396_00660 [Undibacterium terreum]